MRIAVREMTTSRVAKKYDGIWREPDEQSNLYPGLMVHDGVQTGSICLRDTRFPLWAYVTDIVHSGFEKASDSYGYTSDAWDADAMSRFLYCLLEQRGEFGRLMLLIADAERLEHERGIGAMSQPWWRTKRHKKRVGDQLRRCLEALEGA